MSYERWAMREWVMSTVDVWGPPMRCVGPENLGYQRFAPIACELLPGLKPPTAVKIYSNASGVSACGPAQGNPQLCPMH
jgi:hypothetical protein